MPFFKDLKVAYMGLANLRNHVVLFSKHKIWKEVHLTYHLGYTVTISSTECAYSGLAYHSEHLS